MSLYCTDGVKCELDCKDERLCESYGVGIRTSLLAKQLTKAYKERAELAKTLEKTLGMMDEHSFRITTEGHNNILKLIDKHKEK